MAAKSELGIALSQLRPPKAVLHRVGFDSPWRDDGANNPYGTVGSYEMSFPKAMEHLHANSFSEYIASRKEKGLSTHVLDVFGGGYFIHDLNSVDSIIGVRLSDVNEKLEAMANEKLQNSTGLARRFYEEDANFLHRLHAFPRRKMIHANAFHHDTPRRLREQMKEFEIPSFDLITCRPGGVFYPFDCELYMGIQPKDAIPLKAVYLRLFKDLYNLLSSENGILVSEVPYKVHSDSELHRFQKYAKDEGIIAGWDRGRNTGMLGLFIEKTNSSPKRFDAAYKNILRDVD